MINFEIIETINNTLNDTILIRYVVLNNDGKATKAKSIRVKDIFQLEEIQANIDLGMTQDEACVEILRELQG